MFKQNEFNALLAKNGFTKERFAERIGMAPSTFHRKLNRGADFSYPEMCLMVKLLGKQDLLNIFF